MILRISISLKTPRIELGIFYQSLDTNSKCNSLDIRHRIIVEDGTPPSFVGQCWKLTLAPVSPPAGEKGTRPHRKKECAHKNSIFLGEVGLCERAKEPSQSGLHAEWEGGRDRIFLKACAAMHHGTKKSPCYPPLLPQKGEDSVQKV